MSQQRLYPDAAPAGNAPSQSDAPNQIIFGYQQPNQQQDYQAASSQVYGVPPKKPVKRSSACVCTCCCFGCFIILACIVSVAFMVILTRCSNPMIGIENMPFVMNETIKTVEIKLTAGEMYIHTNASLEHPTMFITTKAATISAVNRIKVSLHYEGGVYSIVTEGMDSWNILDCPRLDVDLQLPTTLAQPIDIVMENTNGNIDIGEVNTPVRQLIVSSVNGHIDIAKLTVDDLQMTTTNGHIEIDRLIVTQSSYPCKVEAETVNGHVEFETVVFDATTTGKPCVFKTDVTNGHTECNEVKNFRGKFKIETVNGSAYVSGYTGELEEDNHEIKTGKVGSGSMNMELQSVNGHVNVKFV